MVWPLWKKGDPTMKMLSVLTGSAAVITAFSAPSAALAAPGAHLNWGHELHASEEACPSGRKVLNVVRKIINAVDSGTGSNVDGFPWWADTDYVQQIQVVQTGPDSFRATVKSQGSFESVGGDSPGCVDNGTCGTDEGTLGVGVIGTFQGGMISTFAGTLSPNGMRTKGSIGILDAGCDPSTPAGCPAPVFSAWLDDYFPGFTGLELPWWGWVYHAGNNGIWVNKTDGNEGDITGN
jgi:hypothetical protein